MLPFVERYRPRTLDDVVGQKRAVERLKKVVMDYKNGKADMPHFLFVGSPGIGKTAVAQALTHDLFGEDWRNHILQLNSSSDRGIDVVRDRIRQFASSATIGQHFNVVFLDEVDGLTKDAQNALRGTMEEYAKNCRFILSCNNPNKVHSAIANRCVTYKFTPLSIEEIVQTLEKICLNENIQYVKEGLVEIAKVSKGSLRGAINELQGTPEPITPDKIVTVDINPDVIEIVRSITRGEVRKAEEATIRIIKEGNDADTLFLALQGAIASSDMTDMKKSKCISTLGEYHYRILYGCNVEIQTRCFLHHMISILKS